MLDIRIKTLCLLLPLSCLSIRPSHAQGTVPTFTRTIGGNSYTLAGRNPADKGEATIPTVLVPITLSFGGVIPAQMNATPDVPRILKSPIFTRYAFAPGNKTQYADALLRATFPADAGGHTYLGKPEIKPLTITIPPGYGYVLRSKKSGTKFAVVDVVFLEKQIFQQIPRQDGKLVIAVTHNTTFYTDSDATVCCTWGMHGVDGDSGNSFVLGSYLGATPAIVKDQDIQPLTQQLAEFINDPLHEPDAYFHTSNAVGNFFAAWLRPGVEDGCGGSGIGSNYFLLEPTNTNPTNNFPVSTSFVAHASGSTYHLANVATLHWYMGSSSDSGQTLSFPDSHALSAPAQPCPERRHHAATASEPTVAPIASTGPANGHALIGYWTGSRFGGGTAFPLRDVSPQWDVIIVAFAPPDPNAPEGTLSFSPPVGITPEQLKADIPYLKGQGKKVMLSLGGGGKYFKLDDAKDIPNFVSSLTSIISEYGFDGVDIDFESPSLVLAPGDTDFKHPTTPSIVNLIAGLRQLRDHFGPTFMISLVPEGTQIPGGYPSYGGQFGSYLPLIAGLRDILSFVDVQDYNTPPLQGLDGEIYQSHSVNYHAAMTELLLRGFDVGGDPRHVFSGLPANKVAVGFLTDYSKPEVVSQAMSYIITGKAPAAATYKLHHPRGYPDMIGAMFWTIDADRQENYRYSNLIGPQLHSYPKTK